MAAIYELKEIPTGQLKHNEGQIKDIPANPRIIEDEAIEKLAAQMQSNPDFLQLRELIVYPYGKNYIVLCGNARLSAGSSLGYASFPCKVLSKKLSKAKVKEFIPLDNSEFGENDFDRMVRDWDVDSLLGMNFDAGAIARSFDRIKLESMFGDTGNQDDTGEAQSGKQAEPQKPVTKTSKGYSELQFVVPHDKRNFINRTFAQIIEDQNLENRSQAFMFLIENYNK